MVDGFRFAWLPVSKATFFLSPHSSLIIAQTHTPGLPFWDGKGVDFVVFNPPYVPTPPEEVGGSGIEASWAGGLDGRVVIDRALGQIGRILRGGGGVCYMITVDDNRPEELLDLMQREHRMRGNVLMRRKARNEMLSVLKFVKEGESIDL